MSNSDDFEELKRLCESVPGTIVVQNANGNLVAKDDQGWNTRNVYKTKDRGFGLWFGDYDFLKLDASFEEAVAFLSGNTSPENPE